MPDQSAAHYDPKTDRPLTFHDAVARFRDGSDTPRAYLERCLETIARREGEVMAFAYLNTEGARMAADAASVRYRQGQALSPVDGLPTGIKDLMETRDMPTEYGSDLFRGNRPIRDAAPVAALRDGGAVLVGKTETVCLGSGDPARTRNPHDLRRTPGGSSAGSAAAIAARMLPVTLGTHARGSTIRPASFCGAFAIKPTFGAINRQGGFSMAHSMDHVGVFAGSLADLWIAARYTAAQAGGDPGYPGLYGGALPPAPMKPARLIRLDMAGWTETDAATRAAFERSLAGLAQAGVTILSRRDDPAIETYERELAVMPELWRALYRYEMRWPMLQYLALYPDKMPPRLKRSIADGAGLTETHYREALVKRAYVRGLHEELSRRVDGFITLASPGPGPIGMDQGSAIYNEASSVLGAPAMSLPLLAVEGMPVGIQLLGPWHGDERLVATARWIAARELGREV
ncbi:MAG TPA: amidase [Stellaceae bacterium]|nr:amidase [Stellaceae bacterium]